MLMNTVIDDDQLAELITAAGLPPAELDVVIERLGAGSVGEALLVEVSSRARLLAGPATPVVVQFDVGFGDARLLYLLTVGPDACTVEPGRMAEPMVTYRQDLAELLCAVFAPGNQHHDATRDLWIRDSPRPHGIGPDDPWLQRRRQAVLAAHQAVEAITRRFTDLTELAVRFDADKWGGHWYTPHYQRYLESLRDEQVKVLEIGVGGYDDPALGGASLRMWKHYFWRGQIYGLDINAKHDVTEPRLRTLLGDQGDTGLLADIIAEYGPFDVVIDDGSHIGEHVRASFSAIYPTLRPGGCYIIEDMQSSYWPGWGGSIDLNAPSTSMALVKELLDGLNHQEQIRTTSQVPSPIESTVTGVHVHHNMAIIEKGTNNEQGPPSWIPRIEDPRVWYAANA